MLILSYDHYLPNDHYDSYDESYYVYDYHVVVHYYNGNDYDDIVVVSVFDADYVDGGGCCCGHVEYFHTLD